MDTTTPLLRDAGIRFGIAHVFLISALLVAGAFRLHPVETEVLVGLVMALYCARLPVLLRPAMGAITWAFVTGFVVNAFGQLTFRHADLLRLGAFVGAIGLLSAARPHPAARTGRLVT